VENITIAQDVIQYAPILVVVMVFLLKNKIFVTPEQLARHSKEITRDVEKRFLTL